MLKRLWKQFKLEKLCGYFNLQLAALYELVMNFISNNQIVSAI